MWKYKKILSMTKWSTCVVGMVGWRQLVLNSTFDDLLMLLIDNYGIGDTDQSMYYIVLSISSNLDQRRANDNQGMDPANLCTLAFFYKKWLVAT